jgi:hypothetical protein
VYDVEEARNADMNMSAAHKLDRRGDAMATAATELGESRDMVLVHPLPYGFNPHAPEISIERIPYCPVCRSANRAHFASGYDYELETCRNE